jgi:hypothetical protein
MKRTVLHVNVRRYSEIPLVEMAAKVGEALDCTFSAGKINDTEGFIAHFLGLNVRLIDWRGLGDRLVFILASMLEEDRFLDGPDGEKVDLDVQEISSAIADLLTVREGGDWHPVTDEEGAAEREHAGRIAERIRLEEEDAVNWVDKPYRLP